MSRPLDPIPADLTGRTALVTGATAGIGREVAWGLARLGAQVVVAARSQTKAAALIDELVERGATRERLRGEVADLGRTPAVWALARRVAEAHPRLDILINNAGCYPANRVITEDGFEESWATNVLAYEILTTGLRDAVVAAGGRIVYVASTMAGDLDPDDLDWTQRRFGGIVAYRQSKQANRMLGWAWARRLEGSGATLNVAHPGGVATNLGRRQKGLYGLLTRIAFRTQRSPARGADTPLWLAASPELAGQSGGFYKDRARLHCRWHDDVDEGEQLWRLVQDQIAATRPEPSDRGAAW